MDKIDIKSLNMEELIHVMEEMQEKSFRAKQIYEWIHVKFVENFDEMTNLSKDFREKCKDRFILTSLKPVKVQESKIDGTRKYLFALRDGNLIESVWMKYHHGNSVCVSSQVGCRMGCRFCASTIDGLVRSLTASEMLDQIYAITRLTGERVSNVVIMGSGEPMDNYDNVIKFIRLLSDEKGAHISQRNITLSTCGIVPQIKRLAEEDLAITLAISLHASSDEKRKKLMPIARQYSLKELMDVCRLYFDKTHRRITFEYSLVGGVNDTDEDAQELTKLIEKINCHVNLIPVNPIKERDFVESEAERIKEFKNKLEKNQINVTIRREMGRDIDGACGQLRRSFLSDNLEK